MSERELWRLSNRPVLETLLPHDDATRDRVYPSSAVAAFYPMIHIKTAKRIFRLRKFQEESTKWNVGYRTGSPISL